MPSPANTTFAGSQEEVTSLAIRDGMISGGLMLIPSSFALWIGMMNPTFVKVTNWQSRTAMLIMPPLFSFALSAEQKVIHRMREVANEKNYSREVTKWGETTDYNKTNVNLVESQSKAVSTVTPVEDTEKLHALYRKSVDNSGVRVVPGQLGIHHQMANFWQDNPFKILVAAGVPTVVYIFKGKSKKKHLQLQSKLMQTRVIGQFAILSMLLGLMGFKSYMDSFGKFITEQEAEERVEEMKMMRKELMDRIALDKKINEQRHKVFGQSEKKGATKKKKGGKRQEKSKS